MEHVNSETKKITPINDIYKQQQQLKKQQELLEQNKEDQEKDEDDEEQEQEQQGEYHQKHQQSQQQQQQQQHKQQHNEQHQQQFCLRWHNHQTSLLSTLPILLDQCQLTDVTLSAEGRTLRAHRVVLSACSTFFLEIFRSLDTNNHPVIIIPGASFAAIVALLTFMYSGEVNVYEEQIPVLLSLAETLGIKGLTDIPNNDYKTGCKSLWQKSGIKVESSENNNSVEESSPPSNKIRKVETPHAQPQIQMAQLPSQAQIQPLVDTTSSLFQSLLQHKLATLPASSSTSSTSSPVTSAASIMSTPLENFFLKSLQFYPNLLQPPLNFAQIALDKYQQQYLVPMQMPINAATKEFNDECTLDGLNTRFTLDDKKQQQQLQKQPQHDQQTEQQKYHHHHHNQQQQQQQQRDLKRLDKIADNMKNTANTTPLLMADNKKCLSIGSTSLRNLNNTLSTTPNTTSIATTSTASPNYVDNVPLCYASRMSLPAFNATTNNDAVFRMDSIQKPESPLLNMKNTRPTILGSQVTPSSSSKACSNSKLYATCFICHKQLSNQYNLRVHLETHQNVRYACNVCPHVSRSKDALRKHVSYRHPGVSTLCETDTRRKRGNRVSTTIKTGLPSPSVSSIDSNSITSSQSAIHFPITPSITTESETLSAVDAVAHLKSAAFMFLPTQYHLVAAAAAAADQHIAPYLIKKDDTNTKAFKNLNEISIPTTTSALSTTGCTELTASSVIELTKCLQSNNNNNNNNKNNNYDIDANTATTKKVSGNTCSETVVDQITLK